VRVLAARLTGITTVNAPRPTGPRRPPLLPPEREPSSTGEHVRVAREELERARQHLERAKTRLKRTRDKGPGE
jgi:hypothetical protein